MYKRISLMTNYVSINNTILRDIVPCFNSHASCTREFCLVFDENTHCFQSYNQGDQLIKKTGNY